MLRHGLRFGVAAVAAGLSVVATPAAGAACADRPDADPAGEHRGAGAQRTSSTPARMVPPARREAATRALTVPTRGTAAHARSTALPVPATPITPIADLIQGALLLLRRTATPAVSPAIGLDFSLTYADPAPGYDQSLAAIRDQGITRLRMYDIVPSALSAIQATIPDAKVSVAIPNGSVSQLAGDPGYAATVLTGLAPYTSIVDTIVVGNEVDNAFAGELGTVTTAVANMQRAIAAQGLPIATTVSFTMGIVTDSYPPSNAVLNPALNGLPQLLAQLTDYVEIDIYPLLTLQENPGIPLSYALGSPTCLKSNNCAVVDQGVTYHSLFWAEYDAVRWALNKANVSLPLYVGETGWATDSSGGVFPDANVANAQSYNQNLINSVLMTGSPKFKDRAFPTNVFEFVDENQKAGGVFEKYWGWFGYTGTQPAAKYSLDLTPSSSARPQAGRITGSGSGADATATQVVPRNGWKAFEVIAAGENPGSDGSDWSVPGTFDGLGARVVGDSTLRLQISHEELVGTISEVDLDLAALKAAIAETIRRGSPGGVPFVTAARPAYARWSSDGGSTWTPAPAFGRFCSGQSYRPDTFGAGRGFADDIYITGEEVGGGRLVALDLAGHDLYQLSGVAGGAAGGVPGLPFDAWENAALVDTGETGHVALLLSPDGGTRNMTLYIGEKGRDATGAAASDFLSRNGLAYGSYYYLNAVLPPSGTTATGTFDATAAGALNSGKLEDVDTSPGDPTRVVQGVQETGLFAYRFQLDFSGGAFDASRSGFTVAEVAKHNNDTDGLFGDADNVDWTAPTTLGGRSYPDGLIFVNEDSGTANGETWMVRPDGGGLIKIADTIGVDTAFETSGILDISALVGYRPGSVLLVSNQGIRSALTALINPAATPL